MVAGLFIKKRFDEKHLHFLETHTPFKEKKANLNVRHTGRPHQQNESCSIS